MWCILILKNLTGSQDSKEDEFKILKLSTFVGGAGQQSDVPHLQAHFGIFKTNDHLEGHLRRERRGERHLLLLLRLQVSVL